MRWALIKSRLVYDVREMENPCPLPNGFWAFTSEFLDIGDQIGARDVPRETTLAVKAV